MVKIGPCSLGNTKRDIGVCIDYFPSTTFPRDRYVCSVNVSLRHTKPSLYIDSIGNLLGELKARRAAAAAYTSLLLALILAAFSRYG
jgi:hypothetical protein